ncbi:MAG: hypothetical protein ACT4PP_14395 [Sporichthyaceae bacterium]
METDYTSKALVQPSGKSLGLRPPQQPPQVLPSRGSRWWMRWSRVAICAAAAVLALGITAGTVDALNEQGPRLGAAPELVFDDLPLSPAAPDFSLAGHFPEQDGEIVVHSVTPLMSANVAYLGASMARTRPVRRSNLVADAGYPQPALRITRPLGTAIAGTKQVIVMAGFRLLSEQVGAVNGLEVVYSVDGRRKRTLFPYAAIVCFDRPSCAPRGAQYGWQEQTLHRLGVADNARAQQ